MNCHTDENRRGFASPPIFAVDKNVRSPLIEPKAGAAVLSKHAFGLPPGEGGVRGKALRERVQGLAPDGVWGKAPGETVANLPNFKNSSMSCHKLIMKLNCLPHFFLSTKQKHNITQQYDTTQQHNTTKFQNNSQYWVICNHQAKNVVLLRCCVSVVWLFGCLVV